MAQPERTVDVHFSLTDATGAPVANAPVRIVVGSADGWEHAAAGARAITNASGRADVSAKVPAETRRRKMPTAFWPQLLARPLATQHFTLSVELPFLQRPWLYVADLDVFPDGTNVINAMRMFGADADGNFTVPTSRSGDAWTLPRFPGLVMPAGHDVAHVKAVADAAGARWTVTLAFRRQPEPARR